MAKGPLLVFSILITFLYGINYYSCMAYPLFKEKLDEMEFESPNLFGILSG